MHHSLYNRNTPEIVPFGHRGIGYILFCTTTLYNIEYDSINGKVKRFVATASNVTVAYTQQGPIQYISRLPGAATLKQAEDVAIFSANGQELVDKVALAYSRTALALST